MLYDRYQERMKSVIKVLSNIRRFRVLIFAILALIAALLAAFFATQGIVYGEAAFPETMSYGDEFSYSAKALFSDVTYEYRADGSTEWLTEFPSTTGKYWVRAVSKGSFGTQRYSKEHSFAVTPRTVIVNAAQNNITYGELPGVTANALRPGDSVFCSEFSYADRTQRSTMITPVASAVVIRDQNGVDVTANYTVQVSDTSLYFDKRPIGVTVAPVTVEYSGQPLTSEVYEVSGGSLAWNDRIITVFTHSQTEIGECLNDPEVRIVNADGADVTAQYDMKKVAGVLKVEKRVVIITTLGAEFLYDGTAHQNPDYTIENLVEGHTELLQETTSITNVGETENLLSFDIQNADGVSVMEQYYVVEFVKGMLKVNPRAVTVQTASTAFRYDGTVHSDDTPVIADDCDGLATGHSIVLNDVATILNVGKTANVATAQILCGETDVTENYAITYVNGELEVTPRPVTVTADSVTRVYDAAELTSGGSTPSGGENEGLIDGHVLTAVVSGSITDVGREANVVGEVTISDAEGNDMSANYNVNKVDGVLRITPRPLTVTAASQRRIYDATPLVNNGYTLSTGENVGLVQGHTVTVEIVGTITNVGTVANAIVQVDILDAEGEDMGANYRVVYVSGVLEITKRPIRIATMGSEKVYDGTELTNTLYDIERADPTDNPNRGLLAGHEEFMRIYGSAVTVTDDARNLFEVRIEGADEETVTSNYEIEYVYGELKIYKRDITLYSNGSEKLYDGTALYCHSYGIDTQTGLGLAENEVESVSFTGVAINVTDDFRNLFTVVIKNAANVETTENYNVTYRYGTLTIHPRLITVTSGSDHKIYDATPLTYFGFSIEGDGLAPDQHAVDLYTGTITNVWENSENNNLFTVEVKDNSGQPTTENYVITYVYGTLRIDPRPITVISDGATKIYDGYPLTNWHHSISTTEGMGLVAGQSEWTDYTGTVTNVWDDPNNYFTIVIRDVENELETTKNYDITYVYGQLIIEKREIVVTTRDRDKTYDALYIEDKEFFLQAHTPLADMDHAVLGTYTPMLDVGEIDNVITILIMEGESTPKTDNYKIVYEYGTLIIRPRAVTVTAQSAKKVYDGKPLVAPLAFVTPNADLNALNELCGNLITWKVVHATGEQLDVGVSASKLADGDIVFYRSGVEIPAKNLVITYIDGELEVTKRPITVYANDDSKVYDATPLTNSGFYWELMNTVKHTGLLEGHSIETEAFGTITNVGEENNILGNVVILDAGGADVTANYDITKKEGKLKVTPRSITVTTANDKKVYDDTPLTNDGYSWDPMDTVNHTGLVNGQALNVNVMGTITDVGKTDNIYDSITITDANGVNVTENYKIIPNLGKLEVTPRRIVITPKDAEKVYDATPLTQPEYDYTKQQNADDDEGLVIGQRIEVTMTADSTRTNWGETPNRIGTVRFFNAKGYSVLARNYTIVREEGTLTVTKRPVTVTSGSGTKMYDGTPLTNSALTFSEGEDEGIVSVHYWEANFTNEIINVWDYTEGVGNNAFGIKIFETINGKKTDVTDNYEIERVYGELIITKRPISVVSDSADKVYDGKPLNCKSVQVVSDIKIADTDEWSVTEWSEIIDVKKIDNKLVIALLDKNSKDDKSGNYEITYEDWGTLEIFKRDITITSTGADKVYDGTPLFQHEVENEGLVEGETILPTLPVFLINVGRELNALTGATILNQSGKDVTQNYNVTLVSEGFLEITPRPITITAGSADKVYDGTPLTLNSATSDSGTDKGVAPNQSLKTTVVGSIIDVGTVPNVVSEYAIYDADLVDVTSNYAVTLQEGVLEIRKRDLKIVAASDQKTYDGTALTNNSFDCIGVAPNQTPEATIVGSIVNVGTVPNAVSGYVVYDANGKDVTFNYNVSTENGVLEITPRGIILEGASAKKYYDGTPLTDSRVTAKNVAENDGLLEGHTVMASATGSITEIGTVPNPVSNDYVILDEDGNNVTANYAAVLLDGFLTVEEAPEFEGSEDGDEGDEGEDGNDGNNGGGNGGGNGGNGGGNTNVGGMNGGGGSLEDSGQISGGEFGPEGQGEPVVLFSILASSNDRVYVRYKSFGDYSGNSWDPNPTVYPSTAPYSANYLMGVWLEEMGYTRLEMQVKPLAPSLDYLLPYYIANDGTQTDDTVFVGDATKLYSVFYYAYDHNGSATLVGQLNNVEFNDAEQAYREFVYRNYTAVRSSTLEFMQQIIAEQGFDRNDPQILNKVASYIQNAATYNLFYPRELDDEEDIVVAFLTEYKQGICQHYASAATLLFRALGIPARYTIGFVQDSVAGEWTDVTNERAHAWVEVYVDGFGWVNVEVTGGGYSDGEIPDEFDPGDRTRLDVEVYMVRAPYTGEKLAYLPDDWFCDSLPEGWRLELELFGWLTDVGTLDLESLSHMQKFKLYDAEGNDVTDDYYLNLVGVPLEITQRKLVLEAASAQKAYDGTPLQVHACTVARGYDLIEGHYIDTVICSGKITEVGTTTNKIEKVIIRDAQGNDVTKNYAVSQISGTLTVVEGD